VSFQEHKLTRLRKLVRLRGGELLSDTYIDSSTPLTWSCRKGHQWVAPLRDINWKHWCPICYGERRLPSPRLTLEVLQEVARKRGGECLSVSFTKSTLKLRWRCKAGHVWDARAHQVLRGSWCPDCAGVRKLTIGEMHSLAENRGGRCLSEEYIQSKRKLLWRCAWGHEWWATACSVRQGSWCPRCAGVVLKHCIDDMHEIARNREGKCLSKRYVNNITKLLWECRLGHKWRARPVIIICGAWCPRCANHEKLGLKRMHIWARRYGGRCLSTEYKNNRTPLLWECKVGHRWKTIPANIRDGRWCPRCRRDDC
jgi:hypothetical protein